MLHTGTLKIKIINKWKFWLKIFGQNPFRYAQGGGELRPILTFIRGEGKGSKRANIMLML